MKRLYKRIQFLFTLPRSVPFIKDFFASKEVKWVTKILFSLLIIGYIIFPFDIIPDFLFVFGLLDDITIAIVLLQFMVKIAPKSLKEKYGL